MPRNNGGYSHGGHHGIRLAAVQRRQIVLPQLQRSAQRRKYGDVAQICNLPYRRFVIGRALNSGQRAEPAPALQNGILRYSRFQICATSG